MEVFLIAFFSSFLFTEMDEMILHCNQNTVYVLNTSYTSYGVSRETEAAAAVSVEKIDALNIHFH